MFIFFLVKKNNEDHVGCSGDTDFWEDLSNLATEADINKTIDDHVKQVLDNPKGIKFFLNHICFCMF